MKKILSLLLMVYFFAPLFAQKHLNIMTFNIRLNTKSDKENAWEYRKDNAASQVLFHEVDILGVQEALHDQMEDLEKRLPNYEYVGVGRDNGKKKGEYSAIFYQKNRLKVLKSETFWLAEDPQKVGTLGWDASYPRVVTWAKMKDRKTRKTFYVFNTHFDHKGVVARRESALLLLKKVQEIAGDSFAIVMGDFNSQPMDEPIQILMDSNNTHKLLDTKALCGTPHYGPTGTFNGFMNKEINNQPIDYIFVNQKVSVFQHATLSQTWEGRFSSDHFPVFTRLSLD